jgi:PAS domain S-box-containing protein
MSEPLNFALPAPSHTATATSRGGDWTIDDVPVPVCLIGFDGRFRRINVPWSERLGHSDQALLGKPFAKIIHPDDAQVLVRQMCDPSREAPPENFEARFRCGNGSFKWFHCETKPIPAHEVFALVAVEISDRKDAESVTNRRATVASLRADIWATLGGDASAEQILGIWTDLLRSHLDLPEAQIWIRGGAGSELVLRASTKATGASDFSADSNVMENEIRQVGQTDVPIIIADVDREPQLESRLELFRRRAIRGVIVHPVRTSEHVIAILVVFFANPCGSTETALIDAAAAEMGNALARLFREEQLLENKRDRERLLGTPLAGFCRVDLNQNVVVWNQAAERLLGWSAADMLGRRMPIATEEGRALIETRIGGALLGLSTEKVETTLCAQNGRTVDVAFSIAPLCDAAGSAIGAWITFIDLSDHKLCERFLNTQKQITEIGNGPISVEETARAVLGALAASLGCDVGELWERDTADGDPFRRTTTWHSGTTRAREFDLESRQHKWEGVPELARQILDANAVSWRPKFSLERGLARSEVAARCGLHDAIGIPIAIGESHQGVLLFFGEEIAEPDSRLFGFLTASSQQFGQLLRFRCAQQLLNDARQDLLQANKMDNVGRLVGGVVHDFNNLLTIILGYGEIVLEDCGSNGSTRDLINEILGAGKRAAGLTRQLLGFCRKEAAEPIAIDLNSHLSEMQKMLERLIGEHIELATTLASNVGCVRADPAHIEQVVMNLVVNARDAMPHGGQIGIQTRRLEPDDPELRRFSRVSPGRYVLLSVSDNGCGMDEATRNRIFDPFFTTKENGMGVGMGLATVSEIIGQYEGRIEVESAPGRGTTFRILLPSVTQGLAPWHVDSSPVVVPRGDETILLVEDDDRVRQLIARGLTTQGYVVLAAGEPTRALELWREKAEDINLLITDVMLPTIRGSELGSRIKGLNASVRVLYISGYGEEDVSRSELVEQGAAYLQKPFSIYELARKIREVCAT